MNVRVAPNGKYSIYVEHGVWWDRGTKHIHVTMGDAHWSHPVTHKLFAHYREELIEHDRWPADAEARWQNRPVPQ